MTKVGTEEAATPREGCARGGFKVKRAASFTAAVLLLIAWSPGSQAQEAKPSEVSPTQLTAARAVKIRRIGDLHFSPDGSTLVCVVSERIAGVPQNHLWALRTGREELAQLTFSQKSESSPKWSPSGNELAFLSNRDGATQIYVMPSTGGDAHPVTSNLAGVSSFQWSPDGKQIAFLARAPGSYSPGGAHDEKIADQESDLQRLWILNVQTGDVRQVTRGSLRIYEFDWLTADRMIAVATEHPSAVVLTEAIYDISVADGRTVLAARPDRPFDGLSLAPDRKHFTFKSTRISGPISHDLFLQAVGSGAAINLTAKVDRLVLESRWQGDNTTWIRVADGFRNRILRVDVQGSVENVDLPMSSGAFDISSDGALAFVGNGFNRVSEIYLRKSNGAVSQVSHLQEGWGNTPLVDAEVFRFRSFDGMTVEAALLRPPGKAAAEKLPLVLLAHGGPAGNFTAEYFWFNSWAQLLVAHGYQVLLVNPRGSTGYGENFLKANRGDWGGGDFKDLMAGLNSVIARGGTDIRRLGIGGWSYGGEMTVWATTQTRRFKAAVAGGVVFDQTAEFESQGIANPDEWYLGTPWEHPEVFARNSPSAYIRRAKTPTLILHGEDDDTNPLIQAQALYRALKRYGVEARLVIYPGEGHLPRQEKHQIDALERMVDWFDHHLN